MDNRPIGVFDSGLGGLTVLKQIKKVLPGENIIYFGDVARVPYGAKSDMEILGYTKQAINFFMTKNVKAVVIACNTATAAALNEVKEVYAIPIIGVIESGVNSAVEVTKSKKIVVIGTESTIKSKKYVSKMNEIDDSIEVYQKACPLFVYLVENGQTNTMKSLEITEYYLNEYKNKGIDTIILGCTHYLHLKNDILRVVGEEMHLVDPAQRVAKDLKGLLETSDIYNNQKQGYCEYYTSCESENFKDIATNFMEEEIDMLNIIEIEKY